MPRGLWRLDDADQSQAQQTIERLMHTRALADIHDGVLATIPDEFLQPIRVHRRFTQHAKDHEAERGPATGSHSHLLTMGIPSCQRHAARSGRCGSPESMDDGIRSPRRSVAESGSLLAR